MSKKVITGKVRASYVCVFEPKLNKLSGKVEYSMQLLIPKSDKETVSKIKKAIKIAIDEKWGSRVPNNLKNPLRDGDAERSDREECIGMYFMNVKSKEAPGIIDRYKDDITDARGFSSGDYCRVSLNAFAFDTPANKGVAFGLNNIQKLTDGEKLGGGGYVKPQDEFDEVVDDDDDVPF